jgi:hypothetical protein
MIRVIDPHYRADGKKSRNVWARHPGGEEMHLVLDVQLGTTQGALCGAEPPDEHHAWDVVLKDEPRVERCSRCSGLLRKRAADKNR